MGSFSNPIEPLRSWAVDNSIISAGSIIYAEQWDGVSIPAIDGIGGFVHDGCFRADDTGGWINDYHYDFFAGTHDMWQHLETVYPTYSYFDGYVGTPKCAYLIP
jgi:membrane-bound lytic murein transglycosylase